MATFAVWFRKDLRLHDHTALKQAIDQATEDDRILLLFHVNPDLNDSFSPRYDYYYHTLKQFVDTCVQKEFPVHFIAGKTESAWNQLIDTCNDLKRVYFNYDEVGFGQERDDQVIRYLKKKDIDVCTFLDHHIHHASDILKQDNSPYKVFSAYFKQWQQAEKPQIQKVDEDKLMQYVIDRRDDFKKGQVAYEELLNKMTDKWRYAGEKQGLRRAENFVDRRMKEYNKKRDIPSAKGTSMLSPYLRTGALSCRTLYQMSLEKLHSHKGTAGYETFIQELAWRDFYHMIYHFYPETKDKAFLPKYRDLEWNQDKAILEKWKNGETGFPIVDAAMKQLRKIGWMHNRLRMITASFLTKDLLIDWREGEKYFSEMLIDYDEASNIGGWQWASSTGTDAVPYFRIFNPVRQSERFDPDGDFIKKYLPELKDVPSNFIHTPEKMTTEQQQQYNCVIGKDYPKPIVEHKTQRERALELFKQ
ncbi:cryptochrome/photolyase family protein [Terribacillus saccharophilus]|uniref:cryptochrome/photolyase family protein n=1 Tax=Terribacillus saccharophilus TaxID=361277 RepID=UPI002DD37096|nr:deoxyribodipyrimidine photo-lyase [Terribacillus saccharophilus]MEC0291432.1 deoxyribodipyrimidine photo-lyase [Terribacillus saccharophilus]